MERSTVLGCTAPCHLAWGGGVGGQLAAYFLLSLAVPSCSCPDQINESSGIRTRNRHEGPTTLLQYFYVFWSFECIKYIVALIGFYHKMT